MKRTLLSTLAVALLLGIAHGASAQDSPADAAKPMVTVVFSGYDELKADIGMIGKLGGNPELVQGLDFMLTMMTQGEGLASIDATRPWGVVASAKGNEVQVAAFVPLTDMDKLVKLLGKFGVMAEDKGKGLYEIAGPGTSVFMRKQGTWAVIATSEDALSTAPTDPVPLMGGLEKRYDIAVKATVKNVPSAYKQLAITNLQLASQSQQKKLRGESAEDFAARTKVVKQSVQRIIDLVNESDEVLLGWTISQPSKSAYLDIQVTALPDSKLAKNFAVSARATTSFAGVNQPGAAVTANWAGAIADEDVAQIKLALKQAGATVLKDIETQGLDQKQRELVKQFVTDVIGVAGKTLEGKKADGGMAVMLAPDAATVVLAGVLADGAKLEATLKQLAADAAKDDPSIAKMIKFNAETYKGIRLHTVAIPLPKDEDAAKAAKFIGSPLEVVLGVSDSALYVAAGRNAMKTLKTVVDDSSSPKAAAPFSLSVAVGPIVKFIAAAAADDPRTQKVCEQVGKLLAQSPGKDHLTVISKAIPNGILARIRLEEGLLGLIGGAGKMAGPPMPQGGLE